MKRKINAVLVVVSLIMVILACGTIVYATTNGPVHIKTKGTPSENIKNLFDSVISIDGKSLVKYTDSYKDVSFDVSKEEASAVSDICEALFSSYSYKQKESSPDEDSFFKSEDSVVFSSLDLNKFSEDVIKKAEDGIIDVVKEYKTTVTTPEGGYIKEVYEKAYRRALDESLKNIDDYKLKETIKIHSEYDIEDGKWTSSLGSKFARMLQGGLSDGIKSEKINISKAVKNMVDDSITTLMGEVVLKKVDYSIPRDALVAPKPDAEKYVRVSPDQADQVLDIVAYARNCGLLGEQELIFNPNAEFYPEDIIYYFDESILVICWKEFIHGCVCNCMEVKIADGSQIRRKLTGDMYGSGILDTASNMSAATNAVSAMSADYYAYRDIGVTVYQGQLCRYQLSCENLMIDDQGRFIFYYPDGKSPEELQQFITDNNIQFGVAFGPVLVDNYTPRYYVEGYALGLGQMDERYSRAAFGEYDDLHYLFVTSGFSDVTEPPKDLNAFIDIMLTKNLKNVYNLDGGQTAEIVMQNAPYNHIDYGGERQVSDMIYFATAITENEDD